MSALMIIDAVYEEDGMKANYRLQQVGHTLAEMGAWFGSLWSWSRSTGLREVSTELREQIVKEIDDRFGVPVGGVFRECLNRYFISDIVSYLANAEHLPAIQTFISDECQAWLKARIFKAKFEMRHG